MTPARSSHLRQIHTACGGVSPGATQRGLRRSSAKLRLRWCRTGLVATNQKRTLKSPFIQLLSDLNVNSITRTLHLLYEDLSSQSVLHHVLPTGIEAIGLHNSFVAQKECAQLCPIADHDKGHFDLKDPRINHTRWTIKHLLSTIRGALLRRRARRILSMSTRLLIHTPQNSHQLRQHPCHKLCAGTSDFNSDILIVLLDQTGKFAEPLQNTIRMQCLFRPNICRQRRLCSHLRTILPLASFSRAHNCCCNTNLKVI